ncbi:MAG: SGNH/GDSL hydrolase family protein, partial [Legionellaceae bacterium]
MQHRIENLLVIGDSLTDRGTMARSAIAAFSGLYGKSPHGRFTNGYVWLDYFIQQMSHQGQEPEWIQPKAPQKKSLFSINNDEYVGTQASPIFARTYCIGGMTAYDYSDVFRPGHCILNAEAKVLQTLDGMRQEVITDDAYIERQDDEKKSTLVIEWSGANDLITINEKPTRESAQRAVEARIDNMKALIDQGYRCFVLFNLPDLSLTPRFKNGNADLRASAADSVLYFNQHLSEKMNEIIEQYPDCKINLFDANALFTDAYHN